MIAIVINRLLKFLYSLGSYICFITNTIKLMFLKIPNWNLLIEQFYNIGVSSLTVVAITGASTGIVLAVQSYYQLNDKGLASVTGLMVAKAMITELGPVLTALMVTGRVGSAMCAELGTMQVTEQIDALKSMGVNPISYLIAPRFIAGFIMIPLLTIFSVLLGIVGGYIVYCLFFGMSKSSYFDPMKIHITEFDLFTGLVKSIFFAILLISICCYKGMRTKGGAAGVGTSTTTSVVISYVWILVSDFLITMLLNSVYTEITIDQL